MKVYFLLVLTCLIVFFCWFVHGEIFWSEPQDVEEVTFSVNAGDTVSSLAVRLAEERVIKNATIFKVYVTWRGVDRRIQAGDFRVQSPITLARVVDVLAAPKTRSEKEITLLPGWTLREVAAYFEREGIVTTDEVFQVLGEPAVVSDSVAGTFFSEAFILQGKPANISYEGYLSPNTFRIFSDASFGDIVHKLVDHRDSQFTDQMYADIAAAGRTPFEVLTVASLIEKEVRSSEDRRIVSDLFWRRLDNGWPLQADSSIHYITGLTGDVFTNARDRDVDSPWNTYKYAGLPKGPISMPSLDAIMAAIYPEKNSYWYFLTTLDTGDVHFSKTLDEHNRNVEKYLR